MQSNINFLITGWKNGYWDSGMGNLKTQLLQINNKVIHLSTMMIYHWTKNGIIENGTILLSKTSDLLKSGNSFLKHHWQIPSILALTSSTEILLQTKRIYILHNLNNDAWVFCGCRLIFITKNRSSDPVKYINTYLLDR